jgi:hypothetical protein
MFRTFVLAALVVCGCSHVSRDVSSPAPTHPTFLTLGCVAGDHAVEGRAHLLPAQIATVTLAGAARFRADSPISIQVVDVNDPDKDDAEGLAEANMVLLVNTTKRKITVDYRACGK